MNTLTVQLRSFQDYDINGNKIGAESFGFSVFDDFEERIYLDLNYTEFMEIVRSPQDILDLIFEFWSAEFNEVLLDAGGFYIDNKWFQVDTYGKIKLLA